MIKVVGYIENIIYRNEENYYTIFNINSKGDYYTAVGTMITADIGLKISAELEEVFNKQYGQQYKIINYELGLPIKSEAIVEILSMKEFKGIGEVLAQRIVDNFGEDTFDVILNSEYELLNIKGMTQKRVDALKEAVISKQAELSTFLFLKNNGLSINNIKKIYKIFGLKTIDTLKKNPYIMLEKISGIGFGTCDQLAHSLLFDNNSSLRLTSAIIYILRQNYYSGNVFVFKNDLLNQVFELINIDLSNNLHDLLLELQIKNQIKFFPTDDDNYKIYLYSAYFVESNLSKILYQLKDNIHIITGGPGTGKTYNINKIIENANNEGLKIICCAPTGRAAKRMFEVTKFSSSTIHRVLELTPKIDEDLLDDYNKVVFNKNELNKLDCDILIVDEVSMVDQFLMFNLMKAIDIGTIVYLVGDVDQLPSVSAGNVLYDMINSGWFDVKVLNKIYRQSKNSNIPQLANSIKNGQLIEFNDSYEDFKFVNSNNDTTINNNIIKLMTNNIPKHFNIDIDKIQAICVTKKGVCGTDNLNIVLQDALNPFTDKNNEIKHGNRVFRINDKVMQVVNNYSAEYHIYDDNGLILDSGFGIFNGDIGFIISINKDNNSMKIKFDDRIVEYFIDKFDNIVLAYAITVHKSQGSEYDVVLMPMTYAAHQLLNRKILYTALTRAKDCICFVGNKNVFNKMIENKYENKRNSSLCGKFYIS